MKDIIRHEDEVETKMKTGRSEYYDSLAYNDPHWAVLWDTSTDIEKLTLPIILGIMRGRKSKYPGGALIPHLIET